MRLGLWRMAPLGTSRAQTTGAGLATSMPTTQRISGPSIAFLPALLAFLGRNRILASRPRFPRPWALVGPPGADGAAVRPSTVRIREAGAVGFFGRSSPPTRGPQTVTYHTRRT